MNSISCICLTFNRPERLAEAVEAFRRQAGCKWPVEIVVVNTCPQQTIRIPVALPEGLSIQVFNPETRPTSLGAARNIAIAMSSGTHIVTWDDDDLYLPHYLQLFIREFEAHPEAQWVWQGKQFYVEGSRIKGIVKGSCNTVAYTKAAWEAIGHFKQINVGEDMDFVTRLTAAQPGVKSDLRNFETGFMYCWGNGVTHISGLGDDSRNTVKSWDRADREFQRRAKRGTAKTGSVEIIPSWAHNYERLVTDYLHKNGFLGQMQNGLGVVLMGKFGDIINALPILKRLHEEGKNPHLIVAKQFESVLEGVSYVKPFPLNVPFEDLKETMEIARSRFSEVLRLQIYGKGHRQEHRTASYNMETWLEAGMLADFHNQAMPPVFDRRDPEREKWIIRKLFRTTKPKIVTNLTRSASSPFRLGPRILMALQSAFKDTHEVVEIGNLKLPRIYDLIAVIEAADLMISADTATLHLAAATHTPVIALVNDAPWLGTVVRYNDVATLPYRDADKENVLSLVRSTIWKAPETLEAGVLPKVSSASVAAVIAVYKPDIKQLTRCLAAVLPQVNEVIICGDLDTPWPIEGLPYDPKIRCVRLEAVRTGYGKKATHGARQATSDYVHFLNDDVYLNPDVIQKCLNEMLGSVAVVTHTLRHVDGAIQYAGKFRRRGATGFEHIDFRKQVSRYKRPVEQESACGASMLVDREAFMEVGCYDESYFLYSEDDDLVMKLRQAGYRVMFTPHAEGIHEEHSSMSKTDKWMEVLHESNRIFTSRWGWYFTDNPNPNIIGRFKRTLPTAARINTKEKAIVLKRKIAAGDVLLTTPILAALRKAHPNRPVFIETDYPEIFRGNPNVPKLAHGFHLSGNETDVIDLTMAYESRPNTNYLDAYATVAGVTLADRQPKIYLNPNERSYALKMLGEKFRWCVINAGNADGSRVWPLERYAPVIQHLRNIGFKVVQVGKLSGVSGCDLDLTGKTTIHQLAALIEHCALFIGIDSLPLHLACATGATSIGLFGLTLPELVLPVAHNSFPVVSDPNHHFSGARHRVVTNNLNSIPCDSNPMETITPEHVIEQIDQVVFRLNDKLTDRRENNP